MITCIQLSTILHKTTAEFEDEYFAKAEMFGYQYNVMEGPPSEITYLAYDAVWTLALGINMYATFEQIIK